MAKLSVIVAVYVILNTTLLVVAMHISVLAWLLGLGFSVLNFAYGVHMASLDRIVD